ncbi:VOC family protein [Paenibacillus hodogayensis]|uniref:VOC family protein n=1 Tax=Paenibacillus hodogayensis TaxID=279208 RepID=A0ABV5VUJ6_9BACL
MEATSKTVPLQTGAASLFVHVSDLRRAAEWYSDLLGLPIMEERLNGGPVYWFDLPGTGLLLDDNSGNRENPDWREEMKPLFMFACDNIDEAYDYVQSKAEVLGEPERYTNVAHFCFRSPDGRVYMVCWSKDGGTQPELPASLSPVRPRVGGVFINVRDMRASAAWLSDLLGVPLREKETSGSIYVISASRGADLLLDDNRAQNGDSFEIPFMLDTNDIGGALAYVLERGLTVFHGIERHRSLAFFALADPDGNLVMVCGDDEEHAGDIDGYTLVQLPVRNLKRSVAFYMDMLGYVLEHPERPIEEHAFLRTKSGSGPGLHLCEVADGEFKTDHWLREGKPVHGLELHSRDVRTLHRRLVRSGVRIEAAPYFVEPCGGYVKFYDPDGHLLVVNQSSTQ